MPLMDLVIKAENRLRNHLRKTASFSGAKITFIKQGQNRSIFFVATGKEKYVAHVGYQIKDSGSSIKNEVAVLRFLEKQQVAFVPRVVYFNKREDVSIESYVGKKIHAKDFTKNDIDLFAKKLFLLHSLKKPKNQNIAPTLSPRKEFYTYGTVRMRNAIKNCPSDKTVSFLNKHYKKIKRMVDQKKFSEKYILWSML